VGGKVVRDPSNVDNFSKTLLFEWTGLNLAVEVGIEMVVGRVEKKSSLSSLDWPEKKDWPLVVKKRQSKGVSDSSMWVVISSKNSVDGKFVVVVEVVCFVVISNSSEDVVVVEVVVVGVVVVVVIVVVVIWVVVEVVVSVVGAVVFLVKTNGFKGKLLTFG